MKLVPANLVQELDPRGMAIAGGACSSGRIAGEDDDDALSRGLCGSAKGAPKSSPVGAEVVVRLPLDQKASSCRSICAYRSSARWRLSSFAASTRSCPR